MLRLLAWILQPLNKATGRRWLTIVFMGSIGSAACVVLWPVLEKVSKGSCWLVDFILGKLAQKAWSDVLIFNVTRSSLLIWLALSLIVSLVMFPLVRLGALRLRHIKTLFLYPPAWLAGIIPVVTLGFLPLGLGIDWELLTHLGVVLLGSSLISLLVTRILVPRDLNKARAPLKRGGNVRLPTSAETLKRFADDPSELLEWLKSDAPVKDPANDLFEAQLDAKRIAELITQEPIGRIGLIGPWGVGKTTVLNLVDYLIHQSRSFNDDYHHRWKSQVQQLPWLIRFQPPRILTCRVSAWGFTKESAAAIVLRQAVSELSKHVDCLAIHCLPQEYVAAMKGVGPGWLHGALTFAAANTPSRQLLQLAPLLEAINARLVVFIEDLDRNAFSPTAFITHSVKSDGPNGHSSQLNAGVPLNNNCLLEVASLLDSMRDMRRMSFVLAISKETP